MAGPEPRVNGRETLVADESSADVMDELPLTSVADVESAGRSCMAIVLLGIVILLIVVFWIALRSFGVRP